MSNTVQETPWSEWREASSQADAIRIGQKVWPGAKVGQGPNRSDAWFAIDYSATHRVIEIKNESDQWWVRTRERAPV
jgi:hypothetical protein